MKESELKTSLKQRIFIAIIAVLMLGATLAVYIAIIMNSNSSSTTGESGVDEAKVAQLQEEYDSLNDEYQTVATNLSSKYLEKFVDYRSKVKSFNAAKVNEKGTVTTEDLKVGSGKELDASSDGYGAYYIGWCADEKVFDSSFDNYDSPSSLKAPLVIEKDSLIEGWYLGVAGMKLGGARIITIPGNLAYGDAQNPCNSESEERNVPLRFLIMPIEIDDKFRDLSSQVGTAYMKLLYAQYGMEYTE